MSAVPDRPAGQPLSLRKVGPWFFPADDKVCADASIQEAEYIESAWLDRVKGRRVAVQAGGNCGLFPSKLACYFDAVYTAEPDHANFACLALNCPAPNVYAFRAAFGAEATTIGLHFVPGNAGGHWIEGEGGIPVITIDSLGLPACDLIALDVEGGEFDALMGAAETIDEFKPTLIIEEKGHIRRYGWEPQQMHVWLRERGYESRGFAWRDQIWIHP